MALTVLALSQALRFVSLSPASTEDLFAIGAGSQVVGVDSFVKRPQAATHVERVGGVNNANLEEIVGLEPTAVFYQDIDTPLTAKLRKTGLNVVRIPGRTLADDWTAIRTMGAVADRPVAANALVRRLQNNIAITARTVTHKKRLHVLLLLWSSPIWTAAHGTFVDDLLTKANLVNVMHNAPKPWTTISPEIAAKLDPDVIILADGATLSANVAPWSFMRAVKARHIVSLHEPLDCGPYIDHLFDDIVHAVAPYRP